MAVLIVAYMARLVVLGEQCHVRVLGPFGDDRVDAFCLAPLQQSVESAFDLVQVIVVSGVSPGKLNK